MARRLLPALLPLLVAAASPPEAPSDAAALVSEREVLIDKIVRGADFEESVRRFVVLYRKNEQTLGDAETTAQQLRMIREAGWEVGNIDVLWVGRAGCVFGLGEEE